MSRRAAHPSKLLTWRSNTLKASAVRVSVLPPRLTSGSNAAAGYAYRRFLRSFFSVPASRLRRNVARSESGSISSMGHVSVSAPPMYASNAALW